MQLAVLLAEREDELAADLMEVYGVSLEAAMGGAHSAPFVAALSSQLPQDCRWRVSYEKDAWWTGDRILAANIVNELALLMWGMSDRKKRGPKPDAIGPEWAKVRKRQLAAVAMTKGELLEALARPRVKEVEDGE